MEKNKKQALILSIVAVVTLIALVVGATYAYFKAQGGTGSSTEVKVTTYTTDMLTFTTGNAISLYADQSSFGQEKGSLSGETFAKATLVANNKTNEATDNYYVYFNIENNTFKYTLGEDKPELILTVTGPDGNEVMELPGLTHKVVQDRENKSISGFDVTTTNGIITIANKKTITATPRAEEQYTLKLTFVNYEGDQTANESSGLSAKVMIQKEKIVQTVANICKNGQSLSSCIAAMDGIDETLYHHDGTIKSTTEFITSYNDYMNELVITTYPVGTVLDANDNSYRFAGGEKDYYTCTYNGNNVSIIGNSYNDVNSECKTIYQAKLVDGSIRYLSNEYLIDVGYTDFPDPEQFERIEMSWNEKTNSCYDEKLDQEFVDIIDERPLTKELCTGKSYGRYGGISPISGGVVNKIEQKEINNYVCFGSSQSPCPEDNLYRIIGVFGDKVKLIKADYATKELLGEDGDYEQAYTAKGENTSNYKGNNLANIAAYTWNYQNNTINSGNGSNTWSTSLLNKTNLNKNFITNIGADWAAKIDTTTWKVGGNTEENMEPQLAKTVYQNEVVKPKPGTTSNGETEYSAKVGLMYASDYGFAAAPSAWTTTLKNYDRKAIINVNWMYMGLDEWTISRNADMDNQAFLVSERGYFGDYTVPFETAVRPVFNLVSSTTYVSGDGTQSSPIRIN